MTKCNASQCKKKQWCERYQLYLSGGNYKAGSWEGIANLNERSWISIIDFNDLNTYEHAKLHQLIDNCEYFIPTEQYLIKEKLEKLSNL